MDWSELLERIASPGDAFLGALVTTVVAAVCAEAVGICIGLASALMGRSRLWPVRRLSDAYVFVSRGVPAVVQLFFWYYGVGILFGFNIFPNEVDLGFVTIAGGLLAGVMALGFSEGGYVSEIFRGSINAVDVGHREAAQSVGMTEFQIMRRVILPQAIRIMIPTMGNQFNGMLKYTSLLAFIGVYEIFRDSQVYYADSYRPVEAFVGVAIWYLLLAAIWSAIQSVIERAADIRRKVPKPITLQDNLAQMHSGVVGSAR